MESNFLEILRDRSSSIKITGLKGCYYRMMDHESENVDMRVDNRTTTIRILLTTLDKLREIKRELNRNSDDDAILALIMFYEGLRMVNRVPPPGFEPGITGSKGRYA